MIPHDDFAGPGLWIRTIRERFGPRLSEWMLAYITLAMGLVLLLPSETFAQPSFAGFLAFFGTDENLLGWLMVGLGLARLAGLIVNGARKLITPRIRQIGAGAGFLIFVGITIAFAMSGVVSTWLAIYPTFVVAEIVNMFRASRDAGESRATR